MEAFEVARAQINAIVEAMAVSGNELGDLNVI